MAIYKYLRRDNTQIRLVRLLPPAPHDTFLCLELRHGSIEDGNYSALSYVWGDAADQEHILVNRVLFRIRKNLYQALIQLRSNGVSDWLWIDTLCIQQKDNDEKSYQVGLMGSIFSNAARVYSWLGVGTPSTDVAMDFCARIGPRITMADIDREAEEWDTFFLRLCQEPDLQEKNSSESQLLPGLFDMMGREYWHRIWINQEVALAKEAIVLCGGKSEPLDLIEITLRSLEYCNDHRRSECSYLTRDLITVRSEMCTKLPLLTRRLRQQGHNIPLSKLLYVDTMLPMPHIYTATDPRDIIFALLGLITDNDKLGIRADYHLSMREVFTIATRAMYDHDRQSLNIDACTPRDQCMGELPSWVIDWRKTAQREFHEWAMNHSWNGKNFNATAKIEVNIPAVLKDDDKIGILRRYGYCVDIVTEVWRYDEEGHGARDVDRERADRISSVTKFVALPPSSGPGEDYVWRTLLSRHQDVSNHNDSEVNSLIRTIMREQAIAPEDLTASQRSYLEIRLLPYPESLTWTKTEKLSYWIKEIQQDVFVNESGRTLFKTQKGMLGLGHRVVQPGDVVTLIVGVHSPIVLRLREEGGYNFAGDAYVDGIMQGEFLQTNPAEQEFAIY
ncbi:hypothetical protein IL306_003978 [Fusarium sp. DS 682]|nr:hypothetical protein IL306_003978 [Fusarium sp. DS 682]